MATVRCPQCSRDLPADATMCSGCGRPLNGAALPNGELTARQPTPAAAPLSVKLPPELMEWARQDFNEEEFLAGLREIQETGGLELKDFIQELEQEATPRDSSTGCPRPLPSDLLRPGP